VPSDKGGGVGVLSLPESVCFPRVRELVRVCPGVAVEGPGSHIIPGYVWVEGGCAGIAWGAGRPLGLGRGSAGAPHGGIGGRAGAAV